MTKISFIFAIPTLHVIDDVKAIKHLVKVHAKKIQGHILKNKY
jgi:hypothetical protein